MKSDVNESGHRLERWLGMLRLWCDEVRLRFDIRHSKDFKKLCEESGCPNLSSLEDEYIQKLELELADLQERRVACQEKPAILLTVPAQTNRAIVSVPTGEQV